MANYINFTKATFNPYNPKVLNEGQFSWMTQDTGDQIGSEAQNTIDVYMYDNQGNQWYEKRYEGYGEFGGMDYYELLARMNGYSEEDLEDKKVLKAMSYGKEMRDIGISLAFDKLKTKDRGRKTLFPALVSDPKFNWKRHDFTQEAESDPNQSWYQEPEYDDYEDEYYESEKPELTWDSLKESLGLNEAKKMSIGDQGVDYNDNVVEIVAIGNFKKIAKMFKKEMKEDAADWGYEEAAGDFYLTKTIETEEGNVGDLAIYPVKYDMANYWGLDPLKESVVTEGRSINKISKDHAATVLAMSTTVGEWKTAEGDRKDELMQKLKELNKQKADLEKELDASVAGKDKNVQLALTEAEELAYLEKDLKLIGLIHEK